MKPINVCPGTLASGFNTYSPLCLRKMFEGKKVSHIIDYPSNDSEAEWATSVNRISISGVQEKMSVVVKNGKIVQTPEGESGRYIIKPIPDYKHLRFRQNIPANEHLTMQIASQVYKINTAACALAFFADGSPVYITKRFDYKADSSKVKQDDFASIAGKTKRIVAIFRIMKD